MLGDAATTTVRDATLSFMRSVGMTTIFGNPGSTELPMFRNFPGDFRYVLGLQESVVLGMADGFAQATRNAGFVNLHSAAGVGHALGNLFTAYKNQTPLVITAGQQARSILPYEPFLFADRPTEFPQPYVKWACEPVRAEDVPAAIARAYHVAMQPPCGPTFVSIPVDDWDRPCDPLPVRRVAAANPGDPEAMAEIAQALAAASSPAIVVGAGVSRDNAWDALVALAERHAAAVWVAPLSARCGFPEDHALFAGFLKASREAIVAALAGHDVVLVIGGPLSLYHVEGFGPHAPPDATVFQIIDDPAQAAWAPEGLAVIANARLATQALLAGPAPQRPRTAPPRLVRPALPPAGFTDAHLLARIAALRPAGSIIVEEAASSRGAMHDHLPIVAQDTFYTCASGGLGHGLPAAIGVALARRSGKVIAVLGDGAAMYAIQGLWSAAQLGLAVSFVIVRNRRYQALVEFSRHFQLHSPMATDLPGLDFCALAQAQGVSAVRVEAYDGLDAALSASFESIGPTLVEVCVD
ncbi:benzoylformate decarboxylase [Novosphingobium lentum]|uniref:benzoylformate decarboxylase n=1 Tax=Novosphingobium lentum TaxID=145287 RepID=UPI0008354695|nr:benzoylformate decarboxylase [Novosphingobium lentum]